MNKNLWIAVLLAGLSVPSLRAETPPADVPPADATDTAATRADERPPKFIDELSRKYNVPEADITALRDNGMGWGEIGHALAIAQKSGRPLSEVTALRDSGLGWGEITKKYGFKLGEVTREAKDVERRGNRLEARQRGGRPESVRPRGDERRGPPDHSGHRGGRADHPRGGPKAR